MYATAHRVRSLRTGREGINAFLHTHGHEFPWPRDATTLPEVNPGRLEDEIINVRPGGNRVRAYLDILAPDTISLEALSSALESISKSISSLENPTTTQESIIGIRFGVESDLENERPEQLRALIATLRPLLEAWSASERRVEPGPASEYRARDGATSHSLRGDMRGIQKVRDGQLRQHINSSCTHDGCKATRRLEAAGARFQLGKGRHCEIAMVAAAGNTGLTSNEAVTARREYSEHLRSYGAAELDGPVQNADWAIHIDWAITHFVGNPDAKHPINLGQARAECTNGRYRIIWPIGT